MENKISSVAEAGRQSGLFCLPTIESARSLTLTLEYSCSCPSPMGPFFYIPTIHWIHFQFYHQQGFLYWNGFQPFRVSNLVSKIYRFSYWQAWPLTGFPTDRVSNWQGFQPTGFSTDRVFYWQGFKLTASPSDRVSYWQGFLLTGFLTDRVSY